MQFLYILFLVDFLFDFVVKCDWDRFVIFILIDNNRKGEE